MFGIKAPNFVVGVLTKRQAGRQKRTQNLTFGLCHCAAQQPLPALPCTFAHLVTHSSHSFQAQTLCLSAAFVRLVGCHPTRWACTSVSLLFALVSLILFV